MYQIVLYHTRKLGIKRFDYDIIINTIPIYLIIAMLGIYKFNFC